MNKLQPLSSHSAFYYYHVQSFHVSSGLAVIAVTVQSLGIGWASALASIFFFSSFKDVHVCLGTVGN